MRKEYFDNFILPQLIFIAVGYVCLVFVLYFVFFVIIPVLHTDIKDWWQDKTGFMRKKIISKKEVMTEGSKPDIIVRKIELNEVEDVYSIYCEIENCSLTKTGLLQADIIYRNLIKSNCYTLAAFINNELVGAVNVYKNMQYYPTDLDAPYVHLECCMIKKDYQHKGIGTKLLTEAIEIVKSEGCTYIIAQSPVAAMQKILLKVGLTDTTCKNFGWDR